MVYNPVGIRSLALSMPCIKRTNDYYREKYPDLIATAEQKSLSRLFSLANSDPSNEFDQEMTPYLQDPFRGTVERRVLGSDESSLTLEYKAAKDAIEAAKLSPHEIDLMIVASLIAEQIVPGNAASLAAQLGLTGAAWNLDSMCSNAIVALQTAGALVRAGSTVMCWWFSHVHTLALLRKLIRSPGLLAMVQELLSSVRWNQTREFLALKLFILPRLVVPSLAN